MACCRFENAHRASNLLVTLRVGIPSFIVLVLLVFILGGISIYTGMHRGMSGVVLFLLLLLHCFRRRWLVLLLLLFLWCSITALDIFLLFICPVPHRSRNHTAAFSPPPTSSHWLASGALFLVLTLTFIEVFFVLFIVGMVFCLLFLLC